MKKLFKFTGIFLTAALAAAMGITSFADNAQGAGLAADAGANPVGMVRLDGTVLSVQDGRLHMNRRLENGEEEIVVTISDDTKVLDAVNGYPIPVENLEEGEAVRAYVEPVMTMSLPAITNGILILSDIPADFGFPAYTTVDSLMMSSESSDGSGEYELKIEDGSSFLVNSSTTLLPYLTRNMVGVNDLTPGTRILLWRSAGNAQEAAKIVIFQVERTETAGWQEEEDGWYYYEDGQVKKGWLYEGEDWYYLDPETGRMKTGFVMVDGRVYYLLENGKMMTEEAVFVPDENGALHLKSK